MQQSPPEVYLFALKAVICKKLNLTKYHPPLNESVEKVFKTHAFDTLIVLAGLSNEINATAPVELWNNWSELTKWRVDMRYEPIGTYSRVDVEDKIKALEDRPHGLLTWINNNKKW